MHGDPLAMLFYHTLIRKLSFMLGMLMMRVPVERSLICVHGLVVGPTF